MSQQKTGAINRLRQVKGETHWIVTLDDCSVIAAKPDSGDDSWCRHLAADDVVSVRTTVPSRNHPGDWMGQLLQLNEQPSAVQRSIHYRMRQRQAKDLKRLDVSVTEDQSALLKKLRKLKGLDTIEQYLSWVVDRHLWDIQAATLLGKEVEQ
jgi:hypothetical protein